MSGQRTRKIRFGSSRRQLSNQNEESEADGFHKPDRPLVAQDHMTEDNTAKVYSQSGSQDLPTLDTGNRRKLGSSRRRKGRRDVTDSIAESYHDIREEAAENTTSNKAVVSNSSLLLHSTTEMDSICQSQDIVVPDLSHIQFIHSEKQREETNPESMCTEHKNTENVNILTEQNESLREGSRGLSEDRIVKESEELPTDGRQNEQVIGANLFTQLHQPDDALNKKAHGQEVTPAQIKEMHAPENVDAFGNLTDVIVENRDTYQSELIESVDDPVNEQEPSNPDNKQDRHPTKQNLRHKDSYVCGSSEPRIKQRETAPVQVGEGQGGDDMKAIAEDIVHQEKEKLPWEIEDNEPSMQTLQSDAGEHINMSGYTGKRRKMASTHKKFQDKPKQKMTHEALKQHGDNDNKDVDLEEEVRGGETSELEMFMDFKDEFNTQENKTPEEPLPARVTPELITSTSHEKTSDNIDSPLVETFQLDGMRYPNPSISGCPSSPLYSPPQDNSESLGEQTNKDYQTEQKMSSTHKYRDEEENTEWMQEETSLSHSKTTTTETGSSLEKDALVKSTEKGSEKEEDMMKELESGSLFTVYEEFKTMESPQSQEILPGKDDCQISHIQNIYDDEDARTSILGGLTHGEDFEEQNTEVTSCDIDATRQEIQMKQTSNVIETVEDFTIKDVIEIGEQYDKEAEGSMDLTPISEEDEEQLADHTVQETSTSHEITLLPGAQNTNILTDTLAAFDISHKETLEKEFSEDASEQSEDATDVHQSQQAILDRPNQSEDNNENACIESRGKRKMGSTRRNLPRRIKEEGIDNKDETRECEFSTEVNQETFEAELKTLIQPKCNTSDLHVVFDKGVTDMTRASHIPPQPFNQEENMGIIQMESIIQPLNEPEETTPVDQSKNTSNKDVDDFFLTTSTSAAIQVTDNEEMINNVPKATERGTTDSAPPGLLGGKDDEVTEEVLKEEKEVVEELAVTETSLNTMYRPSDVIIKEEQEHQEPAEIIVYQDLGKEASDLHNINKENNKISGMDVSTAFLTEDLGSPGAASHSEDIGNPVTSVQDSDIRNIEGNVDLCAEPSQLEDITSTEMHVTSVAVESISCSPSQLLQMPPNSDDYINTDPSVIETRKMPEDVKVLQDHGVKEDTVLKSEKTSGMDERDSEIVKTRDSGGGPGEGDENAPTNIQELNTSEGAHGTKSEIENASQDSSSANRRRKMGSTRRNLRVRPKEEDLHRMKQEADNETSEIAQSIEDDVRAESVSSIQAKYLLQMEHRDSDSETVKLVETVKEGSHVCDTYIEPVADQSVSGIEENPVTDGQLVGKESANFPEHDVSLLQTEHRDISDSEQETEKIVETVKEDSHVCDTYIEPVADHTVSGIEENPITDGQLVGKESANFPEHDVLSEFRIEGRRRKMGSTRRNLRVRPKEEDLHRKQQEADNETSEIAQSIDDDVRAESVSSIQAKYLLQIEHRDSDSETQKLVETVKEDNHVCDTYIEPMADQSVSGIEENPCTDDCKPVEKESANFPEHDVLSEFRTEGRRRKLGSTRRNLRVRPKEEDSEVAQSIEDDVRAESVSSIQAEYLLQKEHRGSDSEQEAEKIVCDTHIEPMGNRSVSGIEENPVTDGQHAERKSANFPEHDVLSEFRVEGRRRKMGSNRKSHRYGDPTEHKDKTTDAGDARNLEESPIRTIEEHRAESSGLEKPEVVTSWHNSGKRASSNKSILSTEPKDVLSQEASEPVTPIQHPCPGEQLVQEKRRSLGNSNERDLRSNCYNVVMVGNSNVGKTSFMKRVQSGKFSVDFCASVGIDTCMQSMIVDGKTVVLQLWDTAGQERFHSMTRQILHKAQAFLLMYDITSFQSFSDVRYWVSCIQEGAVENTTVMLLGNKSDCAKRQVTSDEAEVLAKEYNFNFMECSAATGENVIHSLDTVARMLSEKFDVKEEGVRLHKEPQQKKSSGCC